MEWVKKVFWRRNHEEGRKAESSNARSSATQLLHQQMHSVDTEGAPAVELRGQAEPLTGDINTAMISNLASSPSTAVQIAPIELDTTEQHAAVVIQSAYRAFLARRDLRALKGLVRLQALVRGHAVRKQAAETLQHKQALVQLPLNAEELPAQQEPNAAAAAAVGQLPAQQEHNAAVGQLPAQQEPNAAIEQLPAQQEQQAAITIQHQEFLARRRATEVRVPLENQVTERRTRHQQGWCGSIGSLEDMQAKALKKQEAAANRERARAYSSTHQWQAGSSRQDQGLAVRGKASRRGG